MSLVPQKVVIATVFLRSAILIIITMALLAACTGDDDPTPTTPPATPAAGAGQPSPTADDEPAGPTPSDPESTARPTGTSEPEPQQTSAPEPEPTATAEGSAEEEPQADLEALAIDLQEVTSGLNMPVKVVSAYDGSNRLFVVEKGGTIVIVQDGTVQEERFLSIPDRVQSEGSEQGLLGLDFHPDFANNGYFFVNYTDVNGDTVISRFEANAERTAADADTEMILLSIEQPAANHNGGHLLFGPDGYLYIGMGDGGGAGDTYGNAQNGATLLGAMLRIDVDGGDPYGIPEDNPFVGDDNVLDEIWAIGLRNPWRYDFDRETGDLYIADVGQNRIDEVSFQPGDSNGGENYGWPIMEGSECFEAETCNMEGLVLPVAGYTHEMGCSVTGGNVYRGAEYPAMNGVYFYSDFCSGNLWGLTNTNGEWQSRLFLETGYSVSSFGEDEAGEIYFVDMYSGILYRIAAA